MLWLDLKGFCHKAKHLCDQAPMKAITMTRCNWGAKLANIIRAGPEGKKFVYFYKDRNPKINGLVSFFCFLF